MKLKLINIFFKLNNIDVYFTQMYDNTLKNICNEDLYVLKFKTGEVLVCRVSYITSSNETEGK